MPSIARVGGPYARYIELMISGEELVAALRRLDPRDWEVLDLSLRRRVPDEALAKIFDAEPAEVARRRATAIENLADALGVQRGEDLGAVLKALLDADTWEAAEDGKGDDGWQAFSDPSAASGDPLPPPEPDVKPAELKTSEAARLFRLTPAPDPLLEPLPVEGEQRGEAEDEPAEEDEEASGPDETEEATSDDAVAGPAATGVPVGGPGKPRADEPFVASTGDPPPADEPPVDEFFLAAAGEPPSHEPLVVVAGGEPPVEDAPAPDPADETAALEPPMAEEPPPAEEATGAPAPPPADKPPPPAEQPAAEKAAAAVAAPALAGAQRPPFATPGNGHEPEPVLEMLAERQEENRRERFRSPALWALLGGLGAAALLGAGWLGATQFNDSGTKSPPGGDDTRRFLPREGGALAAPFPSDPKTTSCYSTAYVRRPVQLYSRPGGRRKLKLPATTEWGSPRILSVVRRRGDWLAVLAPELKNGEMGWMDIAGVARLDCVRWSVHVDLSRRRLYVRRDGHTLRKFTVAIGGKAHPTPKGRFAVTDKLKVADKGSPYGCCVLALTGHQNKLPPDWPGGDRLAVHATTDLSSIGKAVSLGCMRSNPANVRWLIGTVPIGAPVFIRS
jgi:hypothetical protein